MAERNKSLSVEWFKNLPESEKKEMEEVVRHSRRVLGRLLEIVDEKTASIEFKENASSSYENPAWAYQQAHLNGKRAGLKEIRSLIDFLA